jgi:hypothetical protein
MILMRVIVLLVIILLKRIVSRREIVEDIIIDLFDLEKIIKLET